MKNKTMIGHILAFVYIMIWGYTFLSIPYLLNYILVIRWIQIKYIVQIGHLNGKKSKVLPYLNLWLISHIRNIIYSNKSF